LHSGIELSRNNNTIREMSAWSFTVPAFGPAAKKEVS
jgi:hypothetical protein